MHIHGMPICRPAFSHFNSLNKMNFDATNVLAFNPTDVQAAEARFLRAWSLYYLLDLFGQYPFEIREITSCCTGSKDRCSCC